MRGATLQDSVVDIADETHIRGRIGRDNRTLSENSFVRRCPAWRSAEMIAGAADGEIEIKPDLRRFEQIFGHASTTR